MGREILHGLVEFRHGEVVQERRAVSRISNLVRSRPSAARDIVYRVTMLY